MNRLSLRRIAALLVLTALGAACSPVNVRPSVQATAPGPVGLIPPPQAHPDDLYFINGMIHHHAQAVLMAGWSATHGASTSISTLSRRITVSQEDEIVLMQWYLRDHGEPVTEPNPAGMTMTMNGMTHEMLMPGMLTASQLAELDRARGPEFDRLFLAFMIQHHLGAVSMVETLFSSNGGAQNDFVFKFASDVFADQTTEIERMQNMLDAMAPGSPTP